MTVVSRLLGSRVSKPLPEIPYILPTRFKITDIAEESDVVSETLRARVKSQLHGQLKVVSKERRSTLLQGVQMTEEHGSESGSENRSARSSESSLSIDDVEHLSKAYEDQIFRDSESTLMSTADNCPRASQMYLDNAADMIHKVRLEAAVERSGAKVFQTRIKSAECIQAAARGMCVRLKGWDPEALIAEKEHRRQTKIEIETEHSKLQRSPTATERIARFHARKQMRQKVGMLMVLWRSVVNKIILQGHVNKLNAAKQLQSVIRMRRQRKRYATLLRVSCHVQTYMRTTHNRRRKEMEHAIEMVRHGKGLARDAMTLGRTDQQRILIAADIWGTKQLHLAFHSIKNYSKARKRARLVMTRAAYATVTIHLKNALSTWWYATRKNFQIQRHVLLERTEFGGSGKLLPMEAFTSVTEAAGVLSAMIKHQSQDFTQRGVSLTAIKHRTIAYHESPDRAFNLSISVVQQNGKRLCPLSPTHTRIHNKSATANQEGEKEIKTEGSKNSDERSWPEWHQRQHSYWHLPDKVVWEEWKHSRSRKLAKLFRQRKEPKQRHHAYEIE